MVFVIDKIPGLRKVIDRDRDIAMVFRNGPGESWIEMLWKGRKISLDYIMRGEANHDENHRQVSKKGGIYYSSDKYLDVQRVRSVEFSPEEKEKIMLFVKEGVKAAWDNLPTNTTYSISARFNNTRWVAAPEGSRIFDETRWVRP
jgi:hypothetical protein